MPPIRTLRRITWRNVSSGPADGVKGLSHPERNPIAQDRSWVDLNLSVDAQGAVKSRLPLVEMASISQKRTRDGERYSISGDVHGEKRSCAKCL